jgi:hypothetical protein
MVCVIAATLLACFAFGQSSINASDAFSIACSI